MSLLSGIGRRVSSVATKGPLEHMGTKAIGLLGVAGLVGMWRQHPIAPVTHEIQNQLLGDPNAFRNVLLAEIATNVENSFMGPQQLQRIRQLSQPVQRPRDFAPPGEIVFGMWNSRIGG